MAMRCLFCQKGPAQGVSVYRVNAKGQPGVWACERHMKNTDAKIDPEIKALSEALADQGEK